MNPLKKIANKFLTNKNGTKNKKSNTVDKILGAKAKIMKYGIIAGVAAFLVAIIAILAVVSYFLGFVQEMVEDVSQFAEDTGERVSNSFVTGCILCSDEDLEKLKEEQFKSRIMVIKEVFGEQVDDVVLASTVLFQGDYYDVIDSQYDDNYNESEYKDFWDGMKDALRSFTDSSIEGYNGITSEEINLIDAATIVMVESNVDGKYNEDSYKHALTVNGFVEDPIKNGLICFTEQTSNLLDTILDANPFKAAYDILTQGTRDGLADNALRMVNTADICANGFIGGTFDHIATIQDEGEKQREKEAIAQNIIDFAKFYRELFPEEDLCVYAGSETTGDITNWRQCDPEWANVSIGSSTVCRIGCTTTAISYIIAKSGTQLAVPEINPGVYASEKSGYVGNLINWNTSNIAPNMHSYAGYGINKSNYVDVISSIINTPKDGKQQFVIVETAYGGNTHWAAVDHVENGVVYALDPSSKQSSGLVDITTMHWWAEGGPNSYRVFYADDVPFNSGGSTTSQSGVTTSQSNHTVNNYLSAMQKIANDDSHGYSMSNRTGPDYDCSSFIYYALVEAGVISGDSPFTTDTMGDVLVSAGFTRIPYNKDSLQTGDILVETGAHGHAVTIYSREGDDIKEIAARNNYDGKTGDSGGNEISISNLVETHNYQYIYRLEGASGDYCETSYGSADMDKLLVMLKRLEGEPPACTVRGKVGYQTYMDSMDQSYAGATTAYGLTQVYNRDLAASIGYTNFDSDMSNGCVEKDYIDEMGKKSMEVAVENVRADYESQSGGKKLEEYQYHSLALVYHHWPVGVHKLIGKLAALDDVRTYDAYHWYLYYNGLGGAQGALNRREVEYHLLYNGNYDADRVYDVVDTRDYWAKRVEIYKSEQVS